ncbi:WG repeat-containing protein [Paenibacillus thermotolerans]|uniref:WG repeat-containing protein n=1 Tax=Paenibacillus thermotolerans TaxID=3027807 RepID=UPI00236873F4|nr:MULTISPECIES: WG repeat-containing protein [unclassified Paenibacillus]
MKKWTFIVVIFTLLLSSLGYAPATQAGPAAPVLKYDKSTGLYGYVDQSGKWVIKPSFGDAREFSEGLAAVISGNQNYLWGYIKPDGTFAVEPKYARAYDFKGGRAVVDDQGLAGVIDKNGKYIVKPEYYLYGADEQEHYLAVITDVMQGRGIENGKYGIITSKGVVIKPTFDGAPFAMDSFVLFYTEGKSKQYVDRTHYAALPDGKTIRLEGEMASVSEGMGLIEYTVGQALARSNSNRRYAYLTADGKLFKSYKRNGKEYPFLVAQDFSEGVAAVAVNFTEGGASYNDTYGFLKKDGTWLVEPKYLQAGSFKNGVAPVKPFFNWGYIKKDLTWFVEPKPVTPVTKPDAAMSKKNIDLMLYSQSEHDFVVGQAKSILKKIITGSMSEYEKVAKIHEYVTTHVDYDYDNFYSNNIPRVSYSAYGALKYNLAVCEGYTELMGLMLNMAGVESMKAVGVIRTSGIGHAWNIVKIDGKYYHLDATWDSGNDRNDYFLRSDEFMLQSRAWSAKYYPEAPADYKR